VGKAGHTLERFFEARVLTLLPYLDLRSITPHSEGSVNAGRPSKRRRIHNAADSQLGSDGSSRAQSVGLGGEESMDGARDMSEEGEAEEDSSINSVEPSS